MLLYPPHVAQGVPIADATAVATTAVLDNAPVETPRLMQPSAAALALKTHDVSWAHGLCAAVAKSVEAHPLRICILDNSGSMRAGDGKQLVKHGPAYVGYKTVGCTRWKELAEDAAAIATMSASLGARTDFHLLNPTPGLGACSVCTDAWSGIRPKGKTLDVASLQSALQSVSPNGSTPLTEKLMEVVSMIAPLAPRLRASGHAVSVLICTDGLPNDKRSFVQAMRQLQTLPVWVVVRLVTDDDAVVEYWNDLDRELEAPLEVLDDVRGEAKEVYALNPWLTYAPVLHLARLFGQPEKLFDALDEQPLPPSQIAAFLKLLLGVAELPEPELEPEAFLAAVRRALDEQPHAFDPKSGRMRPWVDLQKLEHALWRSKHCGKGGGGCVVM